MKTTSDDKHEACLLRAQGLLKEMKATLLSLMEENLKPTQLGTKTAGDSHVESKKTPGNN